MAKRIKTNHIHTADLKGRVYCYYTNSVAILLTKDAPCHSCPYLVGSAQGKGVECLYYDGTNKPTAVFYTPSDAEQYAERHNADSEKLQRV